MKITIIIILFITLSSCNNRRDKINRQSNFDYSGVESYFRLIESISVNGTFSESEWIDFLNVEGNRLYIEENNIPEDYLDNIKENIIKVYASKNFDDNEDIVYKIRNSFRKNDSIYREHLKFLKNNEQILLDSMIARTIKFLPDHRLLNDSLPKLYYHALDHDGSANGKGIFISIMAAHQNNSRRLSNFESHEFFHIQRPDILEHVKIDSIDQGIIWALNAILDEGIADMVDKDVMLADNSDWWLKEMVNDFYVGKSKDVISNFNTLIIDETNGKHHSENDYREAFLGSVGHVPGYSMAKLITDKGKSREMIDNADDPFSFFILYNDIASENPEEYPHYDNVAMQYVKELANKYGK
ncbi:MAG: DUF5700 domain-containing putative Zn-dependent protease [Psychroserpens sp.]|uniref:DUF5700 domain-containing putative Zn-dependent protease n=1 Tax=Psychroserpens sp. TaxID=2020870 RepID=UPI003C8E504B